jgi:hypothetical protein
MINQAGVPTVERGSTSGWRRSIAEFTRGWRQFWQGYWQSAHSC